MKLEFIKRGAATRLILIFAGWSTDARYYNDCVFDGWDTAVVSDYRDMTLPPLPAHYATVYVFAYSLGVAAAVLSGVKATARIAICGSLEPVSDRFGIPSAVYQGTLDGLNERSLAKFHLRMAGDKPTFNSIKTKLPEHPDIAALKEELSSIRNCSRGITGCGIKFNETAGRDARLVRPRASGCIDFDRVYLAEDDRIFPYANLHAFWKQRNDTSIVSLKASHAVDIAAVIRNCLPDTAAIGEGFQRAGKSYNENAMIQREICLKIAERLREQLPKDKMDGVSLLEIGPGQGLLTEEWRKMLRPKSATYVDLADVPFFGAADAETYFKTDAEQWLEGTCETFDVILSASTIQWFADPLRFITTVRKHLNHGGIAILSTFVKGNLHQLDALRPSPILYRTAEEYSALVGSESECWERTLSFPSSKEMMMHLKLTGVSPQKKTRLNDGRPDDVKDQSRRISEFPKDLTFKPMIIVIKA